MIVEQGRVATFLLAEGLSRLDRVGGVRGNVVKAGRCRHWDDLRISFVPYASAGVMPGECGQLGGVEGRA